MRLLHVKAHWCCFLMLLLEDASCGGFLCELSWEASLGGFLKSVTVFASVAATWGGFLCVLSENVSR